MSAWLCISKFYLLQFFICKINKILPHLFTSQPDCVKMSGISPENLLLKQWGHALSWGFRLRMIIALCQNTEVSPQAHSQKSESADQSSVWSNQ